MSSKVRRRQESEVTYWVPPPPLPSGDPKTLKSMQQKQRQKKTNGRTHRSKVSSGFEAFRNKRRMSTFDKFLMSRGITPSGRFHGGHYEGGGPATRHMGGSDWDVFESPEYGREYYHNKKTGETRWTCPPEVAAALDAQKESGQKMQSVQVVNPMSDLGSKAYDGGGAEASSTGTYRMYHGPDGYSYYCNTMSGEVSWTLPEGCTLVGDDSADSLHKSVVNPVAGCIGGPTFTAHYGDDGYEYYCNTETGEVTWTLPEGATVVSEAGDDQTIQF